MKQKITPFLLLAFFLHSPFIGAQEKKQDSLLSLISTANVDSVKVSAYIQLSHLIKKSDPKKAFSYANIALQLSEKSGTDIWKAKSLHLIADLYRNESNYVLAKEYYFKAFDLYKALGEQKGMSSASNYIGLMYDNLGSYADALKFYYVSLRINERMNDSIAIAICLNNIGGVNELLGNYDEALDFYFKSLKLKEVLGNRVGVANTNNNIGEVYKKSGKYDEALKYYQKSLQQKKELNNTAGIANTLNNIADVFELRSQYEQAITYYEESLTLFKEIDSKAGIATANNNIGIVYLKKKDLQRAIDYLKKGLSVAQEIDLTIEERKAYLALSEIYEAREDYKQANAYIKLNMILSDSLQSDKSNKLLSEMQAKYESEQNKKEIALLTKEKDVQQLEIYSSRILVASFSIGLILLLVLVIVMIRGYKQKQNTNRELIKKNQDITKQKEEKELLLKEIHHRVKNNLQIINSLLRLQSHQVDDKKVLALFEECQNRILSMAMIHEKLYKSNDLANINAENYITTLAEGLIRSYSTDKKVHLKVECSVETISIDTLMPLGLILNELISNSLKYAFAGKEGGMLSIRIYKKGNDRLEMLVRDDGTGLPADFSWENSTTLGIELIKTLVEQINGTVDIKSNQGTSFAITFVDLKK